MGPIQQRVLTFFFAKNTCQSRWRGRSHVCVRKTVRQCGHVTSIYLPAATRNRPEQLGQVMTVFLADTTSIESKNILGSGSRSLSRDWALGLAELTCAGFLKPLITHTTAPTTHADPIAPHGPIAATMELPTSSTKAINPTILNRRAPSDGDRTSLQTRLAANPIRPKNTPTTSPRIRVSSMTLSLLV